MFYFHKVTSVHYLGDANMFFMCVQNVLSAYSSAKIIKKNQTIFQSYDHKGTATFFLWNTVL